METWHRTNLNTVHSRTYFKPVENGLVGMVRNQTFNFLGFLVSDEIEETGVTLTWIK